MYRARLNFASVHSRRCLSFSKSSTDHLTRAADWHSRRPYRRHDHHSSVVSLLETRSSASCSSVRRWTATGARTSSDRVHVCVHHLPNKRSADVAAMNSPVLTRQISVCIRALPYVWHLWQSRFRMCCVTGAARGRTSRG